MIKNLLLIASATLLLTACSSKEKDENWHSFIYPDKQNTKRNLKSPVVFKSLQQCQNESEKQLELLKLTNIGTYKCGLNCEFHDGMKLEVCEKMLAAPIK